MQYRVCIIVDNPLRDIDGMVLLGWYLARQGVEVFLVPIYQQNHEVFALCPDMVVVNYVRTTNKEFISACSDAGMLVSVLDTEGGVLDSMEKYAKSVQKTNCIDKLDQVFLWGKSQYEAFLKYSTIPAEKLYLTGCPRYDYCVEPWSEVIKIPGGIKNPMILVNTNFPLVNPRFVKNTEEEIKVTVNAGWWDVSYVRKLAEESRRAYEKILELIPRLARALPDVTFIVRPHPFENINNYLNAFSGIENLQVRLEGTVLQWIKPASAVVHLNCSTAVEANLMGKVPVSPEWLNSSTLISKVPMPREISLHTKNFEVLVDTLQSLCSGSKNVVSPEFWSKNKAIIENYYHNYDGLAHARVGSCIMDKLKSNSKKVDKDACKRFALLGAGKGFRRVKHAADSLGKIIFGSPIHEYLRTWVFTKSRGGKKTKKIYLEYVKSMVDAISEVTGEEKPLGVTKVSSRYTVLPRLVSSSVRLSIQ